MFARRLRHVEVISWTLILEKEEKKEHLTEKQFTKDGALHTCMHLN